MYHNQSPDQVKSSTKKPNPPKDSNTAMAEAWAKNKTPTHWARRTGSSLDAIKWATEED